MHARPGRLCTTAMAAAIPAAHQPPQREGLAQPLAKKAASCPPSSAAKVDSSRLRVGLLYREYMCPAAYDPSCMHLLP